MTGAGTDLIVAGLRAAGASVIQATFGQGIVSDPLDKVVSFLVVWLIVLALPVAVPGTVPAGEERAGVTAFYPRMPSVTAVCTG